MAIKPMVGSRLVYGAAGSGVALCFLLFTLILLREGNAFAVFGLIMVGILGFIAYFGARAAVLQANETSIVYRPTVGRPRVVSRAQLASIQRTPGLKGTTYFSFRSADGHELFHAGETYSRNDMEALASYLGVPIRWELTTPR
jgi:hypothetical protein